MQSQYQQQAQGAQPYQQQPQFHYIGFWGRVLPNIIDGFVAALIGTALSLAHIVPWSTGIISLLYMILMEGFFGATVGKFMFRIRVRKVDGSPIGLGAAIVRNLILIIECLTLGIITIISINSSKTRQRWGDRVAGTIVIKL